MEIVTVLKAEREIVGNFITIKSFGSFVTGASTAWGSIVMKVPYVLLDGHKRLSKSFALH